MAEPTKACANCGQPDARLFNWNGRRVCIKCRADLERAARQQRAQSDRAAAAGKSEEIPAANPASVPHAESVPPELPPAETPAATDAPAPHDEALTGELSDLTAAMQSGPDGPPAQTPAARQPKRTKLRLALAFAWLLSAAFMVWAFYYAYHKTQRAGPASDTAAPTSAPATAATAPHAEQTPTTQGPTSATSQAAQPPVPGR